ncbi:hypothetical protein, partial [Candidatus Symbiopectobacterium sp. NZEC135]|uniref:hypothetical protein n=1 Tax=Candidatus Symbiopectobacterium sp. NZEC135 TaxID=2820471 RepID=UPI0022266E64
MTSLIEEGRVILHYEIYGMGCTNYTNFNALSQKIETALGGLFTWLPTYNKTRLVTLIFATVLDMISDSIDNKELSIDYLEDLENYTLSLAKDIVSSLLTKTVNEIANNNDDKRISSIVKNIKHKNNNLIIKTQRPEKTVYIDRVANHFADEESKGLIFYNEHNCWVIDKNLPFNNEVKSTFNLAENFWTNAKNIYFYKNSSPEIYGDGILIRFDGMAYALVGNVFKPALEIQISDNVFRYMGKDDRGYRPITQRAGKWVFESEHTPLASEALISLIESDQKLKNELVSMDIQHHNVGPITAGRKYQFDKYHNKYLKISDEYFRFHVDDSMTMYLEGKGDLLPLTYSGGKFVIKPDLVTGIYSIIKYPLERLPWETYDQDYYIDNTIVNEINKHKILLSAKDSQTISQLAMHALTPSKSIDGAVICEAKEYLPYEDRLISIKANGDDTYILGELTGEEEGIHLYKNQKSNSYYLMPQGAGINSGRQRYKLRSSMCRTKRQIFSLCTADFYESNDISFLLKRNVGAGLKFDSPSEILKPYVGINGFYKDIKLDSKLYYLSNNDVFFHALESPVSDNAIPTYFKLYGKNNDGEINPNFLITDVSIVKDFGTKKII